ncbi:MAG: LysM peptidoglycan-binding domain-containing protein [Chloroflexi bacterium]|nr:MAG: LysM peptidoglycan-binding domain-containing protein [Chloroflexota bacterium]
MPDNDTSLARWLNLYIVLAIILLLVAGLLTVLPNFVGPRLVRRQAMLQLVAEARPTATPTLTPTVGPTPTPALEMGCRRYTVQAGDTLFGLARRFGTTETSIALINDLRSDVLRVGQVLIICGPGEGLQPTVPAPPVLPTPSRLDRPISVVMRLTYPSAIHNRKPQWITLSISLPGSVGAAGVSFLPDVAETVNLEPVIVPVPTPPRIPPDQTARLVEHWLAAKLTGSHVTLRSQPIMESHALSAMLATAEPMTWQWLFTPPDAGDFLFGLDVFSTGEFELVDAAGNMLGTVRTDAKPVWAHEFNVSVDEIFGIPRQWWVLAAGLGTLVNLILGLLQIFGAT